MADLHSPGMERGIIAALIDKPDVYYQIQSQLREDDFYSAIFRLIYGTISHMHHEKALVDMTTVIERLRKDGNLERVGGMLYITEMVRVAPHVSHIPAYVSEVVDYARRRALCQLAEGIKYRANDLQNDVSIADIQGELVRLNQAGGGLPDMKTAMMDFSEWLNTRAEADFNGVLTGIAPLDIKLKGMEPGDLIVIAARPSMGKTALVGQIAGHAASHGKSVLFFSLEMTRNDILARMLAAQCGVDLAKIRSPKSLSESDWNKVVTSQQDMSEWSLVIDDNGRMTPMDILSKARQVQGQSGLDLVIIDYLQLMNDGLKHSGDNRVTEIGNISRGLKAAASELGVPVVVLSQLSRAVESRNDKRPLLSDLRDSGSIEQDADVVMMLYRHKYYYPDDDGADVAEIAIKKYRNGKTGTVKTLFIPAAARFAPLPQGDFLAGAKKISKLEVPM